MTRWIKKIYRVVKFAVVRTFIWLFRVLLLASRYLRDASDKVAEAFNEVVYWTLDIIRKLEGAAK